MGFREFSGEEGRQWRAWDTYPVPNLPQGVASPMVDGWVTFEHGSERRRLSPPPAGWAEASDHQLREWLAAARTIVRVDAEAVTLAAPEPPLPDSSAPQAELDPASGGAPERGEEAPLHAGTQAIIDRSRRTLDIMRQAIEESEERNPDLPDR